MLCYVNEDPWLRKFKRSSYVEFEILSRDLNEQFNSCRATGMESYHVCWGSVTVLNVILICSYFKI